MKLFNSWPEVKEGNKVDKSYEMYSRQMRLDEVGVEGQEKLQNSKVLIIGLGALGSPNALYLASAGVGRIGLVDGDQLEVSNLHRQILYSLDEVNESKVGLAAKRLKRINPDIIVDEFEEYITSENAMEIIKEYDIVVNGTDNFSTRYLVNDACVLLKKPLVDASILRFKGQATVFKPGSGCYRCIFPTPPPPKSVPSCSEAGVLGALAGQMGSLQATEVLKLILNVEKSLDGKLLTYDALDSRFLMLDYQRDTECPVCGDQPTINELIDYDAFCGTPQVKTSNTQKDLTEKGWSINPRALRAQLTRNNTGLIIDVRTSDEYAQFHLENSISIPLQSFQQNIGMINKDQPIYLLCKSGERSAMATFILRKNGFAAYNINGGLMEWQYSARN